MQSYKSILNMSLEKFIGNSKKRKKGENNDTDYGSEMSRSSSHNDRLQVSVRYKKVYLCNWDDMPKHLQFNPYILTGYRPLMNFRECLCSLFYMHNESINIFTHGLSLVYILTVLPGLLPWNVSPVHRFLSLCHYLGALAPWCGSFIYHLFMNHSGGSSMYYKLLQIDMIGIWICQSIGAIPMVTATVYCSSYHIKWTILFLYTVFSFWGLYKALIAWSPWERRLCFTLPFIMRMMLALTRAYELGGGDPQMLHVILQDAVSLAGGIIGAMHIPERWFPGQFDLCLNSHNIMHVMVVLAVYSMHQVTMKDFVWLSTVECRIQNKLL